MSTAESFYHGIEDLPPPAPGADAPELGLVPPLPSDGPFGPLFVPEANLGIALSTEDIDNARKFLQDRRLGLVGRVSKLTQTAIAIFTEQTGIDAGEPPKELEIMKRYFPIVKFLGANAVVNANIQKASTVLIHETSPYEASSPLAVSIEFKTRLAMSDAPPIAIRVMRLWVAQKLDLELPHLFEMLDDMIEKGKPLNIRQMRV